MVRVELASQAGRIASQAKAGQRWPLMISGNGPQHEAPGGDLLQALGCKFFRRFCAHHKDSPVPKCSCARNPVSTVSWPSPLAR